MKGHALRRIISLALALFATLTLSLASVHAQTRLPAQSAQPLVALSSCHNDGCDTKFSITAGCSSDQIWENSVDAVSPKGTHVARLWLFYSPTCDAWWGGLNNLVGYNVNQLNIATWENYPSEGVGCYTGTPCPNPIPPHGWASSSMLGHTVGGGIECYYVTAQVVTDGAGHTVVINTNTYCEYR